MGAWPRVDTDADARKPPLREQRQFPKTEGEGEEKAGKIEIIPVGGISPGFLSDAEQKSHFATKKGGKISRLIRHLNVQ